jgi:heme-degrading monooxygenase HmoA
MYARATTYTGVENIEAGVDYVRQTVVPLLNQQKGYKGLTVSADRAKGEFGVLAFWETAEDRDASDSALAKLRDEGRDVMGGAYTVELFDQDVVEFKERPGPSSALLITRFSMDPAKIDDNVAFFKSEVLPRLKAQPGFQTLRHMINRETGQGIVGAVWADQKSSKDAAELALPRRKQAEDRGVVFGETSEREILFSDLK